MSARRELFSELGLRATRALIVSEGLLVYLDEKEVTSLGQDLAVVQSFQHWVIDLASPALLRMLAKKMGAPLDQAGAPSMRVKSHVRHILAKLEADTRTHAVAIALRDAMID